MGKGFTNGGLLAVCLALACAAPAAAQGPIIIIPPGEPVPTPTPSPAPRPTPAPRPPATGGTSNAGSAVNLGGGVSRTSGTPVNEVVPPLELLWGARFGGDLHTPVIAGGTLFVVAEPATAFALDAQTGEQRWSHAVGGPELAYDQGRLFVAGSSGLEAYDAASGAALWAVPPVDAERELRRPVASDGRVYAADGRDRVHAFDAATGRRVWTATDGEAGQTWPSLWNGRLIAASPCVQTAFDAITGGRLWSHASGCSGGSSAAPAIAEGRVYVDERTEVLDAASGASAGPPVRASAFAPGLGFAQRPDGLAAVGLGDGRPTWSAPFASSNGSFYVTPAVVGATVWSLDDNGLLRGFRTSTGRLRQRLRLTAESVHHTAMDTGVAAAEGILVVPVSDRLIVLRSAIPEPAADATAIRLRYTDLSPAEPRASPAARARPCSHAGSGSRPTPIPSAAGGRSR